MALTTELGKQLYRKCQLEQQMQELENRKQFLEQKLPEAKFARREADVALKEYEWGGMRAFLDKLSGKWEDKRETLARNAAAADTVLANLQRDLDMAGEALAQITREWEALAPLGDPVEAVKELDRGEQELILQKAAAIAVSRLIPLLESAEKALEEAQEWARPNNRIDTAPGYTKGKLLAQAEGCARECVRSLQRLCQCGINLEIPAYFENPSGFIHGAASQFAELDRINRALAAIRRTQTQVKELCLQLADEES